MNILPSTSRPQVGLDRSAEINQLKIVTDQHLSAFVWTVKHLKERMDTFETKRAEVNRLKQDCTYPYLEVLNGDLGHQVPNSQKLSSRLNQVEFEAGQVGQQVQMARSKIEKLGAQILQRCKELKVLFNSNLQTAQDNAKRTNALQISLDHGLPQLEAEYIIVVAWTLRENLQRAELIFHTSEEQIGNHIHLDTMQIHHLIDNVTMFLKELVQDAFVIVTQPSQVIKTDSKFPVVPGKNAIEISLLVGRKLGLQYCQPSVSACLINEETYKEMYFRGFVPDCFNGFKKHGKLTPNSVSLEFLQDKLQYGAVFRKIILEDFKRDTGGSMLRRGSIVELTEQVNEKKWALLFRLEFRVRDIDFKLWKFSLPITIVSHWSQECLASAAVSWDNAFGSLGRIPFQLPDYVTSDGVMDMFSNRFAAMIGSRLRPENLDFLKERLSMHVGYPNHLTYVELCKMHLPNKDFSLWEWFYEGARVIKQCFKTAWIDGHVSGFISKTTAENLLHARGQPGVFLLRFSESLLGELSIVFLHSDGKVYNLKPFRCKQLISTAKTLVEQLSLAHLHCVYPDTRKEVAFEKYYQEIEPAATPNSLPTGVTKGYVGLKTQVILDNPLDSALPLDEPPLQQPVENIYDPNALPVINIPIVSPPTAPFQEIFEEGAFNNWSGGVYDSTEVVQDVMHTE